MRRIMRNFKCLGRRCAKPFTEFVETVDGTVNRAGREVHAGALTCPFCNGTEIQMIVPHYSRNASTAGAARQIDQTLNGLAAQHGLTNMGQRGGTQQGEAAIQLSPAPVSDGTIYSPAPGFSVPYTGGPSAGWSTDAPKIKIRERTQTRVGAGSAPPAQIVGRHTG